MGLLHSPLQLQQRPLRYINAYAEGKVASAYRHAVRVRNSHGAEPMLRIHKSETVTTLIVMCKHCCDK